MKIRNPAPWLLAVLWSLLFTVTASAQRTADEEGRPQPSDPKGQILKSYLTEITPLDRFDKSRFTLMIHAYNPVMARGFVEQLKEAGTYDPKRDINLLEEPERLVEKGLVSASVITENQLPTFGRLIFILGFDPRDILATSPEDGYFIYKEKENLQSPPGPTMTATELVANTKPGEYNEVVLRSENLEILGVAVKHMVRPDGVIDSPADADRLRALAKERGLPVLELHEPCILEDKVEVSTADNGRIESVLLQHNGIGYSLNHYWQQRYFHPNRMDWEDISQMEYRQIRPLLETAMESRQGGEDFLRTLDAALERRFSATESPVAPRLP